MGRLGPLNGQACMRMGRVAWTRTCRLLGARLAVAMACGSGAAHSVGMFCGHKLSKARQSRTSSPCTPQTKTDVQCFRINRIHTAQLNADQKPYKLWTPARRESCGHHLGMVQCTHEKSAANCAIANTVFCFWYLQFRATPYVTAAPTVQRSASHSRDADDVAPQPCRTCACCRQPSRRRCPSRFLRRVS